MLSLSEQKYRLKQNLEQMNSIIWQENKGERFRLTKPCEVKGSLWLRITKGDESFAIATTGAVTIRLEKLIIETIGTPKNKEGTHRDWLNVKFDDAMLIMKAFDESALNIS